MVEVVDHPSKASLEGTLDELGWKHELILENWQIPHCLRGMWVCRVRG
jgi:hypothetical protein